MQLPSPLDARAWPQAARLVGWIALAAGALVAIFAGLSVVSAVVAAQGGIVYALIGGWTKSRDAYELMLALQRAGVPAGMRRQVRPLHAARPFPTSRCSRLPLGNEAG